MHYKSRIKEVNLCGCEVEGNMVIEFLNNTLKVYYQAPDSFIKEFVINNENFIQKGNLQFIASDNKKELTVDLWLVYGQCKKIDKREKKYPKSSEIAGGLLCGEVISILNENELRIDCGIVVDIANDLDNISEIRKEDFIEVEGTYQVYFPNTEFRKE